ncbi:hypothetical protein [Aquimarina sp. 2201CG5-10]|uniref:hypothetical protein n=1 Tax=Aquimarina callyspongiae TaxID=3098150 RepID=UPI002AB51D67|nr:hypothetical protein [Aquimarina sp. 2201CG5-10]MDY8134135.1 hypothetical protein [Aquimarina sp. 2201CG5-10]
MLQNILKFEGVQKLDKNEQKSVQGGLIPVGLGEFRCPGTRLCVIGHDVGGDPICGPCHL